MDWTESVRQDLVAMRRLAEQGGRLTMPGGPYYVVWGVLVGIGFAATYLIGMKIIPVPGWTIGLVWAAVNIAGIAFSIWLGNRQKENPDAVRMTNRIVAVTWIITGVVLSLLFFAILAANYLELNPARLPPWTVGVIVPFIIGGAFAIIALLCRINWMLLPAGLWWVMGIAGVLTGYTEVTMPIYAAATVVLMIGTGLKLMALERAGRV